VEEEEEGREVEGGREEKYCGRQGRQAR